MKNIEKITGKIMQDAQAEVNRITAEADARCREIEEKSETDAKNAYWEAVKIGTEQAKIRGERMMSVAELESKKQVLRVRQEMVAATFAHAAEKLRRLPDEQMITVMALLAAGASETGREEVVLSAADRERIGYDVVKSANAALASRGQRAELTLSGESRATNGGLFLKNGNVEANCTFDAVVNEDREQLTATVAKVLFN